MMNSKGLILDIDDTLAETALTATSLMKKHFGHPFSTMQILEKYDQPGNVPEWQSKEAQEFLNKTMNDEEFLIGLPSVPNSQEVIQKLSKVYPVQIYMTSRLTNIEKLTKHWLEKNDFPIQKIIFRKATNIDIAWKIKYIVKERKDNNIFIDNDILSFNFNLEAYRGKLIWFNLFNRKSDLEVLSLQSWKSIYNYLKR